MYTKVEYLQYIGSMKEAEMSMIEQLKHVLSLVKDPEVIKVLNQIFSEEIRHNQLVDALKKAVEELD